MYVMSEPSCTTLEFPYVTLVMLSFHVLFIRKPTPVGRCLPVRLRFSLIAKPYFSALLSSDWY